VTAFVSVVGTGGTLAGTSRFLKERKLEMLAVCPDPYGAAMWSWFKHGNLDTQDGDSYAEGIGLTRVTKNLEGISVDEAYRIDDQTALTIIHHLLREEGLFVGLSSGINMPGRSAWPVNVAPIRSSPPSFAIPASDTSQRFSTESGWEYII